MRTILFIGCMWMAACSYGQVDTIIWGKRALIPENISTAGFGSFLIDSNFYVLGGWKNPPGAGVFSNEVWKYNIPSDSWSQLGNLPFGGSASSSTFILNGNGYFLTGTDSVTGSNCDNMVWKYNPLNDSWLQLSNFPDASRQNSSTFVYQNRAYVCCATGCGLGDNHLWRYDPTNDSWTQLDSLPGALAAGRAVATVDPNAYFIGGNTPNGGFLGDFWKYNINNDTWDSLGQWPGFPRAFAILWGFDSIIIGGGGGSDTNVTNIFYPDDFYEYNIYTNIWTPIVFENFMDSVAFGATFIYNKTAYYLGGPTDLLYNSYDVRIRSFDASRYISDKPNGITKINQNTFSIYPNPINRDKGFTISSSESGEIVFYDALGRLVEDAKIKSGTNHLQIRTDNEVVFYRGTLEDGSSVNGKVVMVR